MPLQENLTNPLKVALHDTYDKLTAYFKLYHNDLTISAPPTIKAQHEAVKSLLHCQSLYNETLPNNILKACSVFITAQIDKTFAPGITLEGLKKEIFCYTWSTLKEFNQVCKNDGYNMLFHDNPKLVETLGSVDVCLAILNDQLPISSKNDNISLTVLKNEQAFLSKWYGYDETVKQTQLMFEHINKGVELQRLIAQEHVTEASLTGENQNTTLASDDVS